MTLRPVWLVAFMSRNCLLLTRLLPISTVIAAGSCARAQAQAPTPPSRRHWSISYSIGTFAGNPASPASFERAMTEAGLNGSFCGNVVPFTGCRRYPYSRRDALSLSLHGPTVGYTPTPGFQLRLLAGVADMGYTHGRGPGSGNEDLWLCQSVMSAALSGDVLFRLAEATFARLGAGPSINLVRAQRDAGGDWCAGGLADGPQPQAWRPGVVLDGGITFGKRLFAEWTIQYRYIVPTTLGPFLPNSGLGIAMPASRIEFSYALVSAGVGVRF